MTNTATTPQTKDGPANDKHRRRIQKAINRKSFATLATTSPAGRSHSAGVVYETADGDLWVHTVASSRKARNVAENPHVGICIVYRRLPVGPPFTIHFQATANIVPLDDPAVQSLLESGQLKSLTGHGAMKMEGACFIRIRPNSTVHSFGLGVPTLDLIRDPLTSGGRTVQLNKVGRR